MTGPSLGILNVPLGRISRKKRLVTIRQKPIITSYASAFESIAAQREKSDVVGVSCPLGSGEIVKPRQTRKTDQAYVDSISPSVLVQFPVIRLRRKSPFWGCQRLCLHLKFNLLYNEHEIVHVHHQMLNLTLLLRMAHKIQSLPVHFPVHCLVITTRDFLQPAYATHSCVPHQSTL